MSRTASIDHAGRNVWAYDVALGILLKHMIDAASRHDGTHRDWLSGQVDAWRLIAGIGGGNYGLSVDRRWSQEQIDLFLDIVRQACRTLSERDEIPSSEIESWPILDDLRLHTRGAEVVETAPIIELGQTILALVDGTLPPAPPSTWWYVGLPGGRRTIDMAVDEWHGTPDGIE
jgi:hypothetical protein